MKVLSGIADFVKAWRYDSQLMKPPKTPKDINDQVRCFDAGADKRERFTIIYLKRPRGAGYTFEALVMDGRPSHTHGFYQHSEFGTSEPLGSLIPFRSLPKDCQREVLRDLEKHELVSTH